MRMLPGGHILQLSLICLYLYMVLDLHWMNDSMVSAYIEVVYAGLACLTSLHTMLYFVKSIITMNVAE